MTRDCPCGRRTTGYLCRACVADARTLLARARDVAHDLVVTIARQDRIAAPSRGGSGHARPLPLNLGASDANDVLLLSSYVFTPGLLVVFDEGGSPLFRSLLAPGGGTEAPPAQAVAAPARLESLPDVPTTKEAGSDFMFNAWNALVAPRAELVHLLAAAGLQPLDEGPYRDLAHRVDQAIVRDVVVARLPE